MTLPSFSDHERHIRRLIATALAAADPQAIVTESLSSGVDDLLAIVDSEVQIEGRILMVAAGKAALPMAEAAYATLGSRINQGVVICKHSRPHGLPDHIEVFKGEHPQPGEGSLLATRRVLELAEATSEGDLVLCLLSGGASALLTAPTIELKTWQTLVKSLILSGCPIEEINLVRRHLDTVKGGGLAATAHPARIVTLIISDVVGNRLEAIGSGPTVAGEVNPASALAILEEYGIGNSLSSEQRSEIYRALATDEPARGGFDARNYIISDGCKAALAVAAEAERIGFASEVASCEMMGEASTVGADLASQARRSASGQCLVFSGESTVTVQGSGSGGRNQEVALAAAIGLAGAAGKVVASFATDGEDGSTDAAGAFATGSTVEESRAMGIMAGELLANNDSNRFFRQVGGLLVTGPTETNVNDIAFTLSY